MQGKTQGYKVKYYKGLGTSTSLEAKEYFRAINRHMIGFKAPSNARMLDEINAAINLAFNK